MEPHEITPEKLIRTLENRLPKKNTSSSVLVPLIYYNGEWQILFEVRSDTVSHPGEISFPGGHVQHNESSFEAVLRETCEETGIPSSDVTILGGLPRELIQGGRYVRPFVGQIPAESLNKLKASSEVDALFTVPVDYFMSIEPEHYRYKLSIPEDRTLPQVLQRHLKVEDPYAVTPYWEYRGYGIWGLTARILQNLLYLINEYKE